MKEIRYQAPEAEIIRFETEEILDGLILSTTTVPGGDDPTPAGTIPLF